MSVSVLESRIEKLDLADPRARLLPGLTYDRAPARIYLPTHQLWVEPEAPDPAESRLRAALTELGVAAPVVETLASLSVACATVAATGQVPAEGPDTESPAALARAQALLGAVESLTLLPGHLDALLLQATRQLTGVHGKLLLAAKGALSPDELNTEQKDAWRSRAKRVTRDEIEGVTGWGAGEVMDLVAMANTPANVSGPVQHALSTGTATWRLARRYYRATSPLDTIDSAAIANALFGNDLKAAVTERLDSFGGWAPGPWRHKEFYRALDREVAIVNARDPEATLKARRASRGSADVHATLDDVGTATVTISCGTLQATAIADRIERAARAARKAGDPRNLRQLRCDFATALLLHGTLDADTLPTDPNLITTDNTAALAKILQGLPTAILNVIVPLNTLLGTHGARLPESFSDSAGTPVPEAFRRSTGCTCTCTCGARTTPPPAGQSRPPTGGPCPPTGESLPPTGQPCPTADQADGPTGQDPSSPTQHPVTPPAGSDEPGAEEIGGAEEAGTDEVGVGEVGTDEVGVGEILGRHNLFLSPSQARGLALTPGSTMYRLLTDPATGRCVERSTTAYPFDKNMRAQIIAADGFCRAPGCLVPAAQCQIDHVQEHGTPGGATRETNGQALHEAHHDRKTKKEWDAVIHANRDITWTSLLGRIYTTKAHDYNQYTKLLTAATTAVEAALDGGTERATALNDAIYQALSYRPPGTPFQQREDTFGHDDDFTGWDLITLTHTTPEGHPSYQPHPETARTEHQRHTDCDDRHTTTRSNDDTSTELVERDGQTRDEQASAPGTDRSGTAGRTPWEEPHDDPPPF